eukprot:m.668901 g.668901  ORF g.668901 m.668901 type:complete len:97 (+) comp22758_c0_seq7:385-675(+)
MLLPISPNPNLVTATALVENPQEDFLLAVLCLSPKVREKYGSVLLRVLTRDCVPQVYQARSAEDLVYIVAQRLQSRWEQRTWRLSARHRCLRCAWD